MYFLIEDDDLLEKYYTILFRIKSALIQQKIDSETVYKIFLKKSK